RRRRPGTGPRTRRDVLQPVDPSWAPEAIAVLLEDLHHLRREHDGGLTHVAVHPRRLYLEEDVRGRLREARRIEGHVHLPDVGHSAIEIARPHVDLLCLVRRCRVLGLRLTLPLPSAAMPRAGRRLGRARPATHHPEEQEDPAPDEEDLQEADTTAEAVTE